MVQLFFLPPQDNETIEAHNSSDDLWFLEDDFAFEFEVVSSSSGTHSQDQSEDEKSQGSEVREKLFIFLQFLVLFHTILKEIPSLCFCNLCSFCRS